MGMEKKKGNRENRGKVFEMGFWIGQKDARIFNKGRGTEGKPERKSGEEGMGI